MELAMTTRVLPSSLSKSRISIPKPFYQSNLRFNFRPKQGLVYSSSFFEEKSSVVVTDKFEDENPVEKQEDEKKEIKTEAKEEEKEEEIEVSSDEEFEEKNPAQDFLNEISSMLESEDKSKLLIYGSGALLSIWVSSIIISAIDSIPLFPKLMEVVGLGYTVWFTSRYLLFKQNRDELFTQIIDLKDQILGSDNE